MRLTKAPGIDGFLAIFYQKFLHIVSKKVSLFCSDILNEGSNLKGLNATSIVLTPKISNPWKMVNFCPINLYNVVYMFQVEGFQTMSQ